MRSPILTIPIPFLCLLPLAACQVESPDDVLSKDEAAQFGGKSDSDQDLCELYGWYDDAVCDTFCPSPDPDCSPASFCAGFGSLGCADGFFCIDDPDDDCDPNGGGADCGGICVPDQAGEFCGGMLNTICDDGLTCIDVPSDGCDPENGDAVCAGVCTVVDNPEFCGGFGNLVCGDGFVCVDDPNDDCDPDSGGADCGGICVVDSTGEYCGGFGNLPCGDGFVCIDDPNDDCDPDSGGADCGGICVLPDAVCPDPGDPNVHYIADSNIDPTICLAILFGCDEGQTLFSDECGCGCIDN